MYRMSAIASGARPITHLPVAAFISLMYRLHNLGMSSGRSIARLSSKNLFHVCLKLDVAALARDILHQLFQAQIRRYAQYFDFIIEYSYLNHCLRFVETVILCKHYIEERKIMFKFKSFFNERNKFGL